MRKFNILIIVCVMYVLGRPIDTIGQVTSSYRLGIENGLPDGRVYTVLTDHNGYLWIATSKGVVKYNGYELKLFNAMNGLPNEHIYTIVEDRKGRIWMGCIADEMGYIYNNKYYNTPLRNNDNIIYPKDIIPFRDGVIFQSSNVSGDGRNTICIGNGDSLRRLVIPDALFGDRAHREVTLLAADTAGNLALLRDNVLYRASFSANDSMSIRKVAALDSTFLRDEITKELPRLSTYALGNYLISHWHHTDTIMAIDLRTGNNEVIDVHTYAPGEKVCYLYWDAYSEHRKGLNNMLYVITMNSILQFDCNDGIRYKTKYAISEFVGDSIKGDKILTIYQDPFWGNCIGMNANGMYINNSVANMYRKNETELAGYCYMGGIPDSIFFWWSQAQNTMAVMRRNKKIVYTKYSDPGRLGELIHYNADSFLVVGAYAYWLVAGSNRLVREPRIGHNMFSIMKDKEHNLFVISKHGIYTVNLRNKVPPRTLANDMYYSFAYDSLRNNYWAYNTDKVFIHGTGGDTVLTKKQLQQFGIKKLEKVIFDNKYGNIFFSGYNNITIYDAEKNSYDQLFENFNLRETSIDIYKDILIVEGHFGVIFCKILGRGRLAPPVVYVNCKNIFYAFINNYKAFDGHLLVVTEKGTYNITIPTDREMMGARHDSSAWVHKFLVSYRDSVFSVRTGDTIAIDQKEQRILFDVVNRFGYGHLHYSYKLEGDTVWQELNANELTLPRLEPDRYRMLYVMATDNVWKSPVMVLHVYLQPYWWQTRAGQRFIAFLLVIGVLFVLGLAVLITRRIVLRTIRKKNMAMELELRSIYAQINPHFIFNTLNVALFLIKTNKLEEAYQHIFKFSSLLRSYIKSSRTRLIPLEDEINNLRNYIELQQARFKGRFDYEFVMDEKVSSDIHIPSLLLQPVVENAITHGLVPLEHKGMLQIIIKRGDTDKDIVCVIDDNGIGRKQSALLQRESLLKDKGYGSLIVNDLIAVFNKYEQINIDLRYTDKEPPLSGTTATITIKNLKG